METDKKQKYFNTLLFIKNLIVMEDEGFRKITVEDAKKMLKDIEEGKRRDRESSDLKAYLSSHDWVVPDQIMWNMTFFMDNKFEMVHQGDVNSGMLKGVRERIKGHNLYVFREHNPYKPICGPFDGTALRFDKGMAKPLGKENVPLYYADIVLKENGTAILQYSFRKPTSLGETLEKIGWKVVYQQLQEL